jgi:uncharacterized membrane protein YgcG
MVHADEVFGSGDVRVRKFADVAGVFRMKEREPMRRVLERFEARFPQLFVAVYLGAFEDLNNLRQFGFWMLNRAAYEDVDLDRPNSNGILIVVDVNAKSASITYGYALNPYLDENSTFAALSAGHPMFLQADYLSALTAVVRKLERILIKGWRRARRDPESVLAESGQTPTRVAEMLEGIRDGNQVAVGETEVERKMEP